MAEGLRRAIATEPFILAGGRVLAVTISVGVATARDADTTRAVLLRDADRTLYRAKGDGRDRAYHALLAA